MTDVTYVKSMTTAQGHEVSAWYQACDRYYKIVVYVDRQTVNVAHIPNATREQAAERAQGLVVDKVVEINQRRWGDE
jgi:hypothetical protein